MNTQALKNDSCEKKKFHNCSAWKRLAYMALYAVLLHVAGVVMWMVCILQFLFVLGTGSDNTQLRTLGSSLAAFTKQALDFVSYNTESKPFPFQSWPEAAVKETVTDFTPDTDNIHSEEIKPEL